MTTKKGLFMLLCIVFLQLLFVLGLNYLLQFFLIEKTAKIITGILFIPFFLVQVKVLYSIFKK